MTHLESNDYEPKPNYYAVITADVRYCKGLEAGAKLLFGELTALTYKEGYCFAGNQYFADLYEVDIRTITRWITILKDLNFIHVEIEKSGMKTLRKIWIIKENFTNRQNCPPRDRQNCPGRVDKNVQYSNTTFNNTREQQQESIPESGPPPLKPIVVVSQKTQEKKASPVKTHACLESVKDLTQDDRKALSKFPEDRVKLALDFFETEPVKTTLIQGLQWHCSQEKPPKPSKCQRLYEDCKKTIKNYYSESREVVLNKKSITFIPTIGQSNPIEILFSDAEAEKLILQEFKKGKFLKKKGDQ